MDSVNSYEKNMAIKFCERGKIPAHKLAKDIGVTIKTLYNWVHKHGMTAYMKTNKNLSAKEKFKIVSEYLLLSESNKGEYVRSHGLYAEEIEEWSSQMELGLETFSDVSSLEKELKKEKSKNKTLQAKLQESKALLELKKKWENFQEEKERNTKKKSEREL